MKVRILLGLLVGMIISNTGYAWGVGGVVGDWIQKLIEQQQPKQLPQPGLSAPIQTVRNPEATRPPQKR